MHVSKSNKAKHNYPGDNHVRRSRRREECNGGTRVKARAVDRACEKSLNDDDE